MSKGNSRCPIVFISHAGEDSEFAKWIAKGLSQAGIGFHLDRYETDSVKSITAWVNDAAGESDYLVVLLSPFSVDRYWVEAEWSNALMKEADLTYTFVIPAVLPGLHDTKIPFLLRSRPYIDFRKDKKKALSQLVSRFKENEPIDQGLVAPPFLAKEPPEEDDTIQVKIHSNLLGISCKLRVPTEATPIYLMGVLRDRYRSRFVSLCEKLGIALHYDYCLKHKGKTITPDATLREVGVKNGDLLQLWTGIDVIDPGKTPPKHIARTCASVEYY